MCEILIIGFIPQAGKQAFGGWGEGRAISHPQFDIQWPRVIIQILLCIVPLASRCPPTRESLCLDCLTETWPKNLADLGNVCGTVVLTIQGTRYFCLLSEYWIFTYKALK